ncbi:MAG: DUF917 domain-containing protein [Promethearchaeota archaeon]
MTRTLSFTEAKYLVEGAEILGTGGGGDPILALERVKEIYSQERNFKIQEISKFPPDDMICIIGMVGGGVSSQDIRFVKNLSIKSTNVMIEAIKLLEDHLGTQFVGFVSTEMGPGNIVVPLWIGTLLNRVTVDGDMCGGRSKPMISISTTNVVGVSITPLGIASVYGDRIILTDAISDKRAEDICRMISRLAKGSLGVARCPMTASNCQKGVTGPTISMAIELGRKIEIARKNNMNPLPVIRETLNAPLIFTGVVEDFSRTESGGFTSGTILLKSKAHSLKIWYQNEYLLSWLDEKQYVTCPDSLLVVDHNTGKGLTPWKDDFTKNREVAVFMKPSAPIWKTKKGMNIFGPQVFQSGWKYRSF